MRNYLHLSLEVSRTQGAEPTWCKMFIDLRNTIPTMSVMYIGMLLSVVCPGWDQYCKLCWHTRGMAVFPLKQQTQTSWNISHHSWQCT